MYTDVLLHDLRTLGVMLDTDGSELRLSAPTGVLTRARASRIKANETVLIYLLQLPDDHCELRRLCSANCAVLTRDDRRYLLQRLPRSRDQRLRMLKKYTGVWQSAMQQEPVDHRKQNAGRVAANTWLRTDAHGHL